MTDTMRTNGDDAGGATLLRLGTLLLRQWRVVVGVPLGFALIAGVIAFLQPRTWGATTAFVPQARQSPRAGLSGIAAQFGLSLPTDGAETPAFYGELIKTRTILDSVAAGPFTARIRGEERRGSLADVLRINKPTEMARQAVAVDRLERMLTVTRGRESGILRVQVVGPAAELAEQVANRLLHVVQHFNVERRASQARAEREFVQRRLREAEQELRDAEDRYARFLQQNRGPLSTAPALRFESERLERIVGVRQQLFNSLAQAFEQARIEEVRDTPVITVLQMPQLPVRPLSRNVLGAASLGLVVGAVFGLALALFRGLSAVAQRAAPDDFANFAEQRQRTWAEATQSLQTLFRRGT